MKKFFLLFALGMASMGAVAESAPPVSGAETVTISGAEQNINLPSKIYKMWPEDFYKFKGSYDLSNGKTLSLFSRGSRMYAEVEDQPRHEIAAVSPNSFVALDKQLKMKIEHHENGEVSGELFMVVASSGYVKAGMRGEQYMLVTLH
jgi:hypothetical protein